MQPTIRSIIHLAAALFACAALLGTTANAQSSYPDKPVRIIVGFAAGGPTDVIARVVADKLSAGLGRQFVVVNQPGAGSNTASGMVAQAPADGYTLLAVSTGFIINPTLFAKVPYDPVRDFAPITIVAVSPNVISVHPSVPARTVKELIEVVKANAGKYSYASPGVGSTPHLSGEIFRMTHGLDLPTVQFTGAGPAIQSTVGGHTPVAFSALPSAAAQIKDGLLRALAVTAEKRSRTLPDVPTIAEAGFPGQEAYTLTGLLAPAATPKEIVALLHREIVKVLAMPDVQKRLDDLGFEILGSTPEEFSARIKLETEKWGKVIRDAKIKVD